MRVSEKLSMGIVNEEGTLPKGAKKQPLRCGFFILRKNRTCGMQRKKDQQFCAQHSKDNTERIRVPCPLDPSHTVWQDEIKGHLFRCNAKPKTDDERDPWYELDTNSSLKGYDDETIETIPQTQSRDIQTYIKIIQQLEYEPLAYKVESHSGLDKRLNQVIHTKHPIQQSSLVGNLKIRGMLDSKTLYVEFGCGKAELSRFLNLCIQKDMVETQDFSSDKYGFAFIDRGVNRMKNDAKIIKETEEFNSLHSVNIVPNIKRTRIDIKDINLDIFLDDCKYNRIIGLSKHLCGVATDLTLKSILNSKLIKHEKFGGLLIAMCCRHVCNYEQLLPQSKEYLRDKGFNNENFAILKRMVSWAVSGTKDEMDPIIGLDGNQKKQVGITARRLIDESRVYAMRKLLPEYKVEIFWYVERDVTLENVCLCITSSEVAQ